MSDPRDMKRRTRAVRVWRGAYAIHGTRRRRRSLSLISPPVGRGQHAAFDLKLPEVKGATSEATLGQATPTEYRADLVISLGDVRVIIEVQRQRARHPDLAALSTFLHSGEAPDEEVLLTVARGVMARKSGRAILHLQLILAAAGPRGDEVLERLMTMVQGQEIWSEPLKKLLQRKQEEGLEKGRVEGLEQGLEQGRQEKAAEAVIKVLRGRGLEPSEAEREAILATKDLATLDFWLDHAFHVASAAELLQSQPPASAE